MFVSIECIRINSMDGFEDGFYQKEREIDEWENCSSLMGLFYGYERVLF